MIIHIENTQEMINTDHIVGIIPEFRMIQIENSHNIQAFGDIIKIETYDGKERVIRFDTEKRRDRAIDIIYYGFFELKPIVSITTESSK